MVNGPQQTNIQLARQQARVFQEEIRRTGGIRLSTGEFRAVTPAARARISRETTLIARQQTISKQIPGIERELRTLGRQRGLDPVKQRRFESQTRRLDKLSEESRNISSELGPSVAAGAGITLRAATRPAGRFRTGERLGEEVFVSTRGERIRIPSRFDDPQGFVAARQRVQVIRRREEPSLTPAQRIGAGATEQLITGAAGFLGPALAIRPGIVTTRALTSGRVIAEAPRGGELGTFRTLTTGAVRPRGLATGRPGRPTREVITTSEGEFLGRPSGITEVRGVTRGAERVQRRLRVGRPRERELPTEQIRETIRITDEGFLGETPIRTGRARITQVSPRPGVQEQAFIGRTGRIGPTETQLFEAGTRGESALGIITRPRLRATPRAPTGARPTRSDIRQAQRSTPTQGEIEVARGVSRSQARSIRQRLVREQSRRIASERAPPVSGARGVRPTRSDIRQAQRQVQTQRQIQQSQGIGATAARQLRQRLVRQESQRVASQRRTAGGFSITGTVPSPITGVSTRDFTQVEQVTSEGILSPRVEQIQRQAPIEGLLTGQISIGSQRQRRVRVPTRGLRDITITEQVPVFEPTQIRPMVEVTQQQVQPVGTTGFFGATGVGPGLGFQFPPLLPGTGAGPTRRRRRTGRRIRTRRQFTPSIAAGVLGIEQELTPTQLRGTFTGLEIRPLQPRRNGRRSRGLPRGIF